ncbi:MAG: YciK family oxidoreductase [Gammaproteobacteria bacterium]|nr:YciK family oxidoreductase [Gammaproteobacteria bacterium]
MDPKSYAYPGDILRGRIILITGSSDGIGKALALHAARLGAQVILHGRSAQKLEKIYDTIEAIEGTPRPSIAVMDLESANAESYTTLAQSIESEFGRLDGLVLNASILGERYSIEQYDAVLWQKVMHVNVTSVFAMTQVLLPLLQKSDDPSVIYTSSGVGRTGKAFWGAYAASKFATEGMSQVLADEHRHGKLRSNCINPGATRTNMRLAAYPAEDRDLLKRPEDILAPYVYLLGPDSKGVTGESIDAQ